MAATTVRKHQERQQRLYEQQKAKHATDEQVHGFWLNTFVAGDVGVSVG